YDDLDRIISITDPLNQQVTYGYDASGRRTMLGLPGGRTVQYTYNPLNQLTQVNDWDATTNDVSYTYDGANRLSGMILPNGVQATFNYDDDNRLVGLDYRQGEEIL